MNPEMEQAALAIAEDLFIAVIDKEAGTVRQWSEPIEPWRRPVYAWVGDYPVSSIALEVTHQHGCGQAPVHFQLGIKTKAKQGLYTQLEVNRGLPAPMLVRYFQRDGANWVITPQMRNRILFKEHNLMSTPPHEGPFHIVFIRNVLIYFNIETKREVLRRVASVMVPGGYLFLGAAETTMGMDPVWERVTLTRGAVYRLQGGKR